MTAPGDPERRDRHGTAGSLPTVAPAARDPAEVTATETYRLGQEVWVHRDGAWCPGVVMGCSPRAATIRYRLTGQRGTGVDTVTGQYVATRAEADQLDTSIER